MKLGIRESTKERSTTPEQSDGIRDGPRLRVAASHLGPADSLDCNGRTLAVAYGFEDRATESAKRLLSRGRPDAVVAVEYPGTGQGAAIRAELDRVGCVPTTVSNIRALEQAIEGSMSPCLIDSTGMAKPFVFAAVFAELRRRGVATVAHTLAQSYYPRNEDLEAVGVTPSGEITSEILSRVGGLLAGERGPYQLSRIYAERAAPERPRVLIASASPKNDRLLYLLDNLAFDSVAVLVPPPTSARRRVARASAGLAVMAADVTAMLVDVDTNDIVGALRELERLYRRAYFGQGATVELGLTGSKAHAIAFAALAAAEHVAAVWYVSPASYDQSRYTAGVAETRVTEIRILPADVPVGELEPVPSS